MKNSKRLLALLMALTLCLSLVQVTAYAEDGMPDGGEIFPVGDAACEHDWSKYIVTRAATCTEAGEETLACAKCDLPITEVETPEAIEGYAELEKTREIPAAGHTWGEWAETLAATEEAEGEEARVCAVCQAEEKRTTEKLAPALEIEASPVQRAPAFANVDNGISLAAEEGEEGNEPDKPQETSNKVRTFEELTNAVESAPENAQTTITVEGTITITSMTSIPKGKDIVLTGGKLLRCSNDTYNWTSNTGKNQLFQVRGSLTLEDIILDGNGDLAWSDKGNLIYITDGGFLHLKKGAILQNNYLWGDRSGAVCVNESGTVVMEDGSAIQSNKSSSGHGGGVFLLGSKNNDPSKKITFQMKGGKICGNDARQNSGGIHAAWWNVEITLSGNSEISGNHANKEGGGVSLCGENITLTMSGNARINENTTDGAGGGVMAETKARLIMNDGEICDNTAGVFGGGVCLWSYRATNGVDGPGYFIMSGGKVTGNTSATGGGVHVGDHGCEFKMSEPDEEKGIKGGAVYNNTASKEGADISMDSQTTVTLLDISQKGWQLNNKNGSCAHPITGWYLDGNDNRWSCEAPTEEYKNLDYSGETPGEATVCLKAAHELYYGYTVQYYYGKPDSYALAEDETKTGSALPGVTIPYTAGEKVLRNGRNYVLNHVDGEGKTVTSEAEQNIVNIYYELIHKVTWLKGYETEDPVIQELPEVKEEQDITDQYPSNPTREGYEFDGWENPVTDPETGDITIEAKWKPIEDPVPTPRPTPGPGIDFPDPTPTPRPTPVPDEPTPMDPGTNIDDEQTPLAGAIGLNDVDHFAYIVGYDDNTVRPTNNITRAEVATIFFRLMEDDYRAANWSTENRFSDVSAGQWYNNAISTCEKAGALGGYEDGSFRPENPITRAEFAVIASRFLSEEYTDEGVGDFSDTANHWAAKEIRRAVKAGWITGDGNQFRPEDPITRAEVMTIVNRMLDRLPDAEHFLPDMIHWIDNPEGTWYYEAVQEATNEHDYERDELNTEIWTLIKPHRDWSALEKQWADAYAG